LFNIIGLGEHMPLVVEGCDFNVAVLKFLAGQAN